MLAPYDAFLDNDGVVTSGNIRSAATAVLVATLSAFVVGLLLFVFDNGLRSSSLDRRMRLLAGIGLAVVLVGAGAVGLAKVGDPIHYANTKIDEFTEAEPVATSGSTRLGSVGGQRSDLWRVALDEFKDHPLAGAGAGTYQFAYYKDRDTDRNLNDTHSLPMRLLADTGLIGTALFAAWLIALGVAVFRRARETADENRVWVAGLAAAGATIFAQCLTDWLWLLPGLLGLAVLALGLAAGGEPGDEKPSKSLKRSIPRLAWAAALVAALVSVTFLFLGDLYVRKARVEAFKSPEAELSAAQTAATFNPVSVTPLYLQASVYETRGERDRARRALLDALDLEPDNFVTLGLLGDFEVRGGNESAARSYYRRALVLNPLDVGLRQLSQGAE
jgi:tetratricopeptide (TPR) repeat protein